MNDRILVALAMVTLIVGVGAATAARADDDGKMTICHKPEHQARTLEVSRDAWPSHQDHGDHEGACGGSDGARSGSGGSGGTPDPTAHVTVAAEAEGDVDGEADFTLRVRNDGDGDAGEVRLTGRLRGDGDWRVRSRDADCSIEDRVLTCTLDALPADGAATVRLRYDGGARVCHEPGIRLTVEAGNDDGEDDDRAEARTRVGACSVLHRDAPATA